MNRPWFFVWLLLAPALAGIAITVLINVSFAQPALKNWIIAAALGSAFVTLPVAWKLGKLMES